MSTLLTPFTHTLAALLAATQHLASAVLDALGLGSRGAVWVLAIAACVVAVRILLLPAVVHGVRLAHAGSRARPELTKLAERYRNRRDPEARREYLTERRRIMGAHGRSRLGCLPMLVQIPVSLGLYHLLSDVAGGVSVGAMSADLVAGLSAASIAGVPLVHRLQFDGGLVQWVLVGVLAATAGGLAYATQRWFVAPAQPGADLPEAVARVQALMPSLAAVGLVVAAGFVPLALLLYWVCNGAWTCAQAAVVWRWFPTPGSPAALRLQG